MICGKTLSEQEMREFAANHTHWHLKNGNKIPWMEKDGKVLVHINTWETENLQEDLDLSEREEEKLKKTYKKCTNCNLEEEGYKSIVDCMKEKLRNASVLDPIMEKIPNISWEIEE